MDADPATAPATGGPGLWAACEERAVVRLTLAGGQVLTGHYTSRVGLHFLHRTGRDLPLTGEITGPYGPGDVLAVEVVRTRAQVLADAHVRLHGERVCPAASRAPATSTNTACRSWPAPSPTPRRTGSGRCSCTVSSATPPTASAWSPASAPGCCTRRGGPSAPTRSRPWPIFGWTRWPRPPAWPGRVRRIFDPDLRARRRRTGLPAHVVSDPRSIPNMLHALRAASLNVRMTRLGDPPWNRGHLQVEMPVKGRSRFVAIAERDRHGRMAWRVVWDGNHDSKVCQPG